MRNLVIAFLLFVSALLPACSEAEPANTTANRPDVASHTAGGEQPATSKPAARSAPADERTVEFGDFEGTVERTEKKNSPAEAAILSDVRTGRHDRFDRVVFEFSGNELPSYLIEYIDKPVRACGSGDVVPLKGDGWLQIRFEPARAHTEEGKPTVAFRELQPMLPNLLEIRSTCDFEAQVEWVAGVGSPNAYRVIELKDPTRLAVDIRHK
ncbi:MAG TPA: hypothetical protein PKD24_09970 [Pyrinomonadaceae bacterium]|nr:hypothetical protein [Pyrinomonadaceae bacterium]HMP65507.1 hypothetical protein [Pyrinomonadaceae bacterium]